MSPSYKSWMTHVRHTTSPLLKFYQRREVLKSFYFVHNVDRRWVPPNINSNISLFVIPSCISFLVNKDYHPRYSSQTLFRKLGPTFPSYPQVIQILCPVNYLQCGTRFRVSNLLRTVHTPFTRTPSPIKSLT